MNLEEKAARLAETLLEKSKKYWVMHADVCRDVPKDEEGICIGCGKCDEKAMEWRRRHRESKTLDGSPAPREGSFDAISILHCSEAFVVIDPNEGCEPVYLVPRCPVCGGNLYFDGFLEPEMYEDEPEEMRRDVLEFITNRSLCFDCSDLAANIQEARSEVRRLEKELSDRKAKLDALERKAYQ